MLVVAAIGAVAVIVGVIVTLVGMAFAPLIPVGIVIFVIGTLVMGLAAILGGFSD